jgi:hypothetical protein
LIFVKPANGSVVGKCPNSNSQPGFLELPFGMATVLTAATDLATLTEVDGTWEKSHIASEAKTTLA